MTKDDITRMARDAGGHASGFNDRWAMYAQDLERFASLVAAAEREACAALCEARFTGDLTREDMEAKRCAAAIRSRSQS